VNRGEEGRKEGEKEHDREKQKCPEGREVREGDHFVQKLERTVRRSYKTLRGHVRREKRAEGTLSARKL